jgi:hypothetical protein
VLRPALVNVTAALSEEEAAAQEAAKAATAAPAATPDWVEEVAAAEAAPAQAAETSEPAPAVVEAEAAPEAPPADAAEGAAPAPSADQALQKLVKTDDRRSGTETIDINLPPINVLPDMELTAPQAADADGDETVQVYEISEEDANAPSEDLAEAQPAKVSDD